MSVSTLKGSFTAYDKTTGTEIETYEVFMLFPENYPYSLPTVWETGGKISRHLMDDGSLCFGNPQDVAAVCKGSITLDWFLEEILNPHLCREYVREKNGEYPTGERSHGLEGIWEGYYDIFDTTDKAEVLRQVGMTLSHVKVGRNGPCYCGSGKKYKHCHYAKELAVLRPGMHKAQEIYRRLHNSYNSRPR
jgi:hypothetical protein